MKCKWCGGDENGPPKFRHDIGFTCGNDCHSGVFENATREELDSDMVDRAALAILQGFVESGRGVDMVNGGYPLLAVDDNNLKLAWDIAVRFVRARAEVVGKE